MGYISSVKSLNDDLCADMEKKFFFESQSNRMGKIVLKDCHCVKNPSSNSVKI